LHARILLLFFLDALVPRVIRGSGGSVQARDRFVVFSFPRAGGYDAGFMPACRLLSALHLPLVSAFIFAPAMQDEGAGPSYNPCMGGVKICTPIRDWFNPLV
jgi:hypothetical protein